MEKSLGIRLSDCIGENCDLEAVKIQLLCCLFSKKINYQINQGVNSIEVSLKSGANVYGIKYDDYQNKIETIKSKYLTQAESIGKEYEFQFVNLQMELRELFANQEVSLVNAKRCLDMQKEQSNKEKITAYRNNKEKYLKKFYLYNSLINDCETKIQDCMVKAVEEIEKMTNEMSETSMIVKQENIFTKLINKITNIFSGKSKFENKLSEFENKADNLEFNNNLKIEEIKNNTIELVADILAKKDNLDIQNT